MDDERPPIPSPGDVSASLSARVRQVLDAAERSADQIRSRALADGEREAAAHLDEAHRRVDAFAAERARRISDVADRLLAHAEALASRAARAERLRHGIDAVVDALAAAAEAIAAEAGREPPDATPPPPPLRPVPDPPTDDDVARAQVLAVADLLPRRPGASPDHRSQQPPPDPDAAA